MTIVVLGTILGIFLLNIMEQVQFSGSMKNIPQGSREEYVMGITHRMRVLYAGMAWHAAFVLGILKPGKNKETYGFNSLEKFPYVPQLDTFKDGLANIVANLKWKKTY